MTKFRFFGLPLFSLFLFVIPSLVAGQENARFIDLPPEAALSVVAYQKECPVKIEKVDVLFDRKSGNLHFVFYLRNTSKTKDVQSVGLSQWHIGGGGGDLVPVDLKPVLAAGQSSIIGQPKSGEITQITKSMMEELKLTDTKLTTMLVFLVNDVRFTDGSRYSNQKLMDNFLQFSNRVELLDTE